MENIVSILWPPFFKIVVTLNCVVVLVGDIAKYLNDRFWFFNRSKLLSVRKLLPTTFSRFFWNSSMCTKKSNFWMKISSKYNVETIILIYFSANQNCRWWGSCNTKGQKQTTFAKARHNYRTLRRLFKLFRLSNWNWAVMQTPKCVFNLTVILQSNLITVIAFRAFTVYLNKPRHPRQKSNRSDAASSAMTGPTSSIYIKKTGLQ